MSPPQFKEAAAGSHAVVAASGMILQRLDREITLYVEVGVQDIHCQSVTDNPAELANG